ncbi:hypothetical protein EJ05DRAFT_379189 [Pseudovirgaria hyperparasitica]|uniref:Uncharacterized protein n=1 Tax=Pseudovirgaria hyperparasitica TaxID=470096 RepID=A0A6A6W6A9_9PEZI|nr:uncharacterized protein EJ05DRAFT_379189 [Pseudovirgaria hyperparasitica]KAF2758153.1 hypothetical protein EJ05DRAFT_379189 [Pseudovirgaria hyperparasitica]
MTYSCCRLHSVCPVFRSSCPPSRYDDVPLLVAHVAHMRRSTVYSPCMHVPAVWWSKRELKLVRRVTGADHDHTAAIYDLKDVQSCTTCIGLPVTIYVHGTRLAYNVCLHHLHARWWSC